MYNDGQFYMDAGDIARPRELALVSAAGVLLALLMTWPLAAHPGRFGRVQPTDADGQYSVWNVAWVARTIVADPAHLFDANIFFPHRGTLAYSEANLLEGTLAVPFYWSTRNPVFALNVIYVFAFASAFVCAYLLLRYVWRDTLAAAIGGAMYAFCPYVFSHLSHIQLLMTGGIPLSLLMLHRMADRPSIARGVALGAAIAAQGLACAYYGVFAGLLVGYAALLLAATRGLWRSPAYWTALLAGAATAAIAVLPFFLPYLRVRAETGFGRSEIETLQASANLQSYIVSSAHAHRWLLNIALHFERWKEPLFPGIAAAVLGAAGLLIAVRARDARLSRARETAIVYGSSGVLAFWASFGPPAGLYRVLSLIPIFAFLRAPSRFGLLVTLVFAVFAALAIRTILQRGGRARVAIALSIGALLVADLAHFPLRWWLAPEPRAPYSVLAKLPRGAVAEFPFYGDRVTFPLHAQYMLFSTQHWMPLVNGYSDVIPGDFRADAPVLAAFPSRDAFLALARHRVRYIAVHWDMYVEKAEGVRQRLPAYAQYLRPLAADDRMSLYEVVRYP
jgi:hypothetical protein